jgi:outer membrane immunogenic protein
MRRLDGSRETLVRFYFSIPRRWGLSMRRVSLALIAAVFAVAFTPIASAQPNPAAAPVYSWTGFYVGANVGYGWGDTTATLTPLDNFFAAVGSPAPFAPTSFKNSGWVGGFHAGYNWQFNKSWLVGFEADFDFSGIDGQGSVVNRVGAGGLLTATADQHVRWFGTVRGRLGFLPLANLLVYGTGGFAYGKVDESVTIASPNAIGFIGFGTPLRDLICGPAGTPCMTGSSSRTATGWVAGGGAEYKWTPNLTVRVEYLYVNLGSDSFIVNTITPPFIVGRTGPSLQADFDDAAFSVVRVGLSYTFGAPAAANY